MTATLSHPPVDTPLTPALTTEVVEVTPALAEQWLGRNKINRSLRRPLIEGHAQDMRDGHWQMTGEPVIFDKFGWLRDGQHRLHAVVESGVTVPMLVVRGVEPDSQLVMDTGAKRTAADALSLRNGMGSGHARDLASVSRTLLIYSTGNTRPTISQIMTFGEGKHEELFDAAQHGRAVTGALRGGASLWGAAYYLLAAVDEGDARKFFDAVASGAELPAGSPILHLRRRFLTDVPAGRDRHASGVRFNLAHIFKAWNAWRDGKSMQLLRVSVHDNYPLPH